MRRKPERLNKFNTCVLKDAVAGKQLPTSGRSIFDLLQYVYENGGARKVILKQPPLSVLGEMTPRRFLSFLGKCFESELEEEEPRVRPITLKHFFEEPPEKPRTSKRFHPLKNALFLCLNLHLKLPGWVLFGLGKTALALLINQKPRTGRHTSFDARLKQLFYDFRRWETVEEIRENGSPRVPGRKMSLNEAIEEAADVLKGTWEGAEADAVRKSYFKVKKNWVRDCLATTAFRFDVAICRRDRKLLRQATIYMENYHARLRKGLT